MRGFSHASMSFQHHQQQQSVMGAIQPAHPITTVQHTHTSITHSTISWHVTHSCITVHTHTCPVPGHRMLLITSHAAPGTHQQLHCRQHWAAALKVILRVHAASITTHQAHPTHIRVTHLNGPGAASLAAPNGQGPVPTQFGRPFGHTIQAGSLGIGNSRVHTPGKPIGGTIFPKANLPQQLAKPRLGHNFGPTLVGHRFCHRPSTFNRGGSISGNWYIPKQFRLALPSTLFHQNGTRAIQPKNWG